jgi:hypothetical protein
MGITDSNETRLNQVYRKFPVGGGDVHEFTADEILRATAFMDREVRALRTED